jgi:hypothetical protein
MPVRACAARFTAVLLAAFACGGDPAGPGPDPLRTVLVHRQDTGENVLLNTDGSEAGGYAAGGTGLIPLGAIGGGPTLVLRQGDAIVLGSLGQPDLDTLIFPAPSSSSLAGISDDGLLVAVVSYAPTRDLLIRDLVAGATDTLSLGSVDPVLPPVFSPDGSRVALVGLTPLSLTLTVIELDDPPQATTDPLGLSRFTNRPIFGWPRWVGGRIHLAFLRENDSGLDTLLVGSVDPDNPGALMEEEYLVVMGLEGEAPAELTLGDPSSYALSPDGLALILGAFPARDAARHSIYLMSPSAPRARLVRDDPEEFLVFPLFVSR